VLSRKNYVSFYGCQTYKNSIYIFLNYINLGVEDIIRFSIGIEMEDNTEGRYNNIAFCPKQVGVG